MIRLATELDFDHLEALGLELAEHAPMCEVVPAKIEDFIQTCANMMATDDAVVYLVEKDGVVVGMAGCAKMSYYYNYEAQQSFQIFWWVTPVMRKHGLGRELREAMETWAKEQGCVEFHSATHPGLTPDGVLVGGYNEESTIFGKVL